MQLGLHETKLSRMKGVLDSTENKEKEGIMDSYTIVEGM